MLFLDIETKSDKRLLDTYLKNVSAPKNWKDEDKIKAYIQEKKEEAEHELALDQDYSQIDCIAVKKDEEPTKLVTLEELGSLLQGETVVTFNGKNFDLPIIIKNGIKQKINLPFRTLKEMTKRYNAPQHIDLMETLAFGGQFKSLDTYLQIYLGIAKTPIDFKTCTSDELAKHCVEDVDNLYKLYKLFENIC